MPPRPGCGVELTTRSDAADLPPFGTATGHARPKLDFVELLVSEAELDTWRIAEVFSRTGRPFEVELAWSAGRGSGATAQLTVARSARVCLFARSLRIAAANLSNEKNRVGVTVGDGFAVTENQLEVRGDGLGGEVAVPAFARLARLDLADSSLLATTRLRVIDGLGVARAEVHAASQPPAGISLGGASAVEILAPARVEWRVVFTLSI